MDEIQGRIVHILFTSNREDNFKIIKMELNTGEYIIVHGIFPDIFIGLDIECSGEFFNHKRYGRQFRAKEYSHISREDISEEDKILKFLSSGCIKGVGRTLAGKIVDKYKEKTIQTILTSPRKLAKISGISEERALNISEEMEGKKQIYNLTLFLDKYHFSMNQIIKVYEALGDDSIEKIKKNPYILLYILMRIDFFNVDKLALEETGIDKNNPLRINEYVRYTINKHMAEGHTIISEEELLKSITDSLDISKEEAKTILKSEDIFLGFKEARVDGKKYYALEYMADAQEKIAERMIKIRDSKIAKIRNIDKLIEEKEKSSKITLTKDQKEAIKNINNNNISIITGGPGTGKTTIIDIILKIYKEANKKVVVAAPTGKAAKRITEVTKNKATTIHKLLNIGKFDEYKEQAVYMKVEDIDADLLIIDEASMIDIFLLNYIIKAINPGTKLLLIGDIDQLPSVGPGRVLGDLIESEAFSVIYLKEIFRQAAKSQIILNAYNINEGKDIDIQKINEADETDLNIIETWSNSAIFKILMEKLAYIDIDDFFKDSIILTPTKKGECGTYTLNKEIQQRYNKRDGLDYGNRSFKIGDRVMQITNNYDKDWERGLNVGIGIFNGETGRVYEINYRERVIGVMFDDEKTAEYNFKELSELEHCFAMTIHKSQGSEFNNVILVLPKASKILLTRNILYTAMTRAKKNLLIISIIDMINFMKDNLSDNKRETRLKFEIIKRDKKKEDKKKKKEVKKKAEKKKEVKKKRSKEK